MDRRTKVELFEQIRREYTHGAGTYFGSAVKSVGREQPKSVNKTEYVFAVVVLVHVSPVTCDVPGEISERSFARCLQRCEGIGHGYNPTGLELLLSHPLVSRVRGRRNLVEDIRRCLRSPRRFLGGTGWPSGLLPSSSLRGTAPTLLS
jgi:hypothetical protein